MTQPLSAPAMATVVQLLTERATELLGGVHISETSSEMRDEHAALLGMLAHLHHGTPLRAPWHRLEIATTMLVLRSRLVERTDRLRCEVSLHQEGTALVATESIIADGERKIEHLSDALQWLGFSAHRPHQRRWPGADREYLLAVNPQLESAIGLVRDHLQRLVRADAPSARSPRQRREIAAWGEALAVLETRKASLPVCPPRFFPVVDTLLYYAREASKALRLRTFGVSDDRYYRWAVGEDVAAIRRHLTQYQAGAQHLGWSSQRPPNIQSDEHLLFSLPMDDHKLQT